MHKLLMALLGMVFFVQANAFSCYVTFAKDSCWANYNVTVNVVNASNGQVITSITAPQGKSWGRQSFSCQPAENLSFNATFTPAFWESEAGRVYKGRRDWLLPKTIEKNEAAWNITLCYAKEFSEVPLPPDARGNCACDLKSIPPVKPS